MGACNLIVKATRLCNLRCAYCNDWRSGPGNTMPFTVLAHLTSAALQDPRHQQVSFIWHGGEPTVLPIDWYRRAFAIQDFFTRPGQQVRNVIQTNGTRLTPEWAEFLREHDVSVGVSIDGPSWLHDRRRVHVGGAGSFDEVVEGLAVLRRAGVRTSVLMVVDEEVLEVGPERIYDFLVEQGITSFGFNAVVPANAPAAPRGTPAKPYVRPAQMSSFLIRMHRHHLRVGTADVRIREIDALVDRIHGRTASSCQLRGDCLGDYFIVEPDGEVAHCDLYLGDPAYRLGNVVEDSFEQMRAGAPMRALQKARAAELAAMAGCAEFGTCQGWCPHETYLSQRHDPDHRDDCCGLAELISYVRAAGEAPARQPMPLPVPQVRAGA